MLRPVWFCVVLVALSVAGAGCLSRPSYDARGFLCHANQDCDAQTVCILAQCRLAFAGDSGMPDGTTTGVPSGVALKASGDLKVVIDGAVVDGLDVQGCIDVYGSSVTIQRSRIRCPGGTAITVHPGATGTLIQDVEFDGAGVAQSRAVDGESYTVLRANAHDLTASFLAGDGIVVQDSYLHGPGHPDIISNGGVGIYVLHNRIEAPPSQGNCVFLGNALGVLRDVLVQANSFSGGGYSVQLGGDANSNERVLNNRFARNAGYGPMTLDRYAVETGNVWDDTSTSVDGP